MIKVRPIKWRNTKTRKKIKSNVRKLGKINRGLIGVGYQSASSKTVGGYGMNFPK